MHQTHVLLIHRYFHPDTPPYASILRDIAVALGEAGHRVTVLTCQPSYNRAVVRGAPVREQLAPGVAVVRWPVLDDRTSKGRKGLNLMWFCLRLMAQVPRLGRIDAIMAASTPPIAVAATASWLARCRGAAFIYHKQDIYPEVVTTPGQPTRWLPAILRALDSRTDRTATRVVVLSRDMADTTRHRGVREDRIRVINNFDPWQLSGSDAPSTAVKRDQEGTHAGELQVVFAGNLGRFQNLESIFAALVELRHDPVRFHFFGAGALSADLRSIVRREALARVEIHGYQKPAIVAEFLATTADLGIVSLTPGVIRAAYPSKTLSYLRQGTPMLTLVEEDSELAATVRDHRIGAQAEPGDLPHLVATLRSLARDPTRLDGARERARHLYAAEFGREARLDQWTELFRESVS